MLPFKRILCPIDFSADSRSALRAAGEMAQYFSAELTVLHVLDTPTPTTWPYEGFGINPVEAGLSKEENLEYRNKELVAEARHVLPPGTRMSLVIREGLPAEEIIEEALEKNSDIIVMAPHGHGRLHNAVFGSTAAKVVKQSPCPVVTMHGGQMSEGLTTGDGVKEAQA